MRKVFARLLGDDNKPITAGAGVPVGGVYKATPPTLADNEAARLGLDTRANHKVTLMVYGTALPVDGVALGTPGGATGIALLTSGISKPYQVAANDWTYAAAAAGILNTTTAVTIKAAAAASIRNYVTALDVMHEALTNATELAIRDGAAGTVLWRTKLPSAVAGRFQIVFPTPLRGTAATLLEVVTLTASGAGAVYVNAQGYTGA